MFKVHFIVRSYPHHIVTACGLFGEYDARHRSGLRKYTNSKHGTTCKSCIRSDEEKV